MEVGFCALQNTKDLQTHLRMGELKDYLKIKEICEKCIP